jgi:hypothetical protein
MDASRSPVIAPIGKNPASKWRAAETRTRIVTKNWYFCTAWICPLVV